MLESYLNNYKTKCDKAILLSYSDEMTKKIIQIRSKQERAVLLVYAKLFTHTEIEPELVDEMTEEDYRNLSMIFDYSQEKMQSLLMEFLTSLKMIIYI